MNLIRWQRPGLSNWTGYGPLSSLRDEIDRLFEEPLAEFARASRLLTGWTPPLDLHEDKDNFVATIDVPGMKKEDINVTLEDGALSISGERQSDGKFEDAQVYRSERFVGSFQRTVSLPASVAADKIKAQYKDGVLTITLPKTEEAKPKQINVQVN